MYSIFNINKILVFMNIPNMKRTGNNCKTDASDLTFIDFITREKRSLV